ncbi:hypothetical protein GCM10011610_48310 [Nocardia rhizosphaerihabitans]|uniref:DUF3558 domain-containing protein n=1 Tax=Nocardia rhizosphaerihabitans TaxID=1691570 RepID=A0ABQ2KRZ2_9NOCA|nr:hypothetical protein GCM10011610_48310 [Nocardia rhizosphaerihabitans]
MLAGGFLVSLRGWRALGSIALAVAALAGCGPVGPPGITFGEAVPAATAITATLPATDANWPDACAVLTDAEITAILPQATNLTRTPQTVQIVGDTVRNIAQGGCLFTFDLPDLPDSSDNAKITVTFSSVGEEAAVAAHYADMKRFTGDPVAPEWGATECTYGKIIESTVACYRGNFAFSVSGDSTVGGLDNPARFQIWRDEVSAEVVRTLVARMG